MEEEEDGFEDGFCEREREFLLFLFLLQWRPWSVELRLLVLQRERRLVTGRGSGFWTIAALLLRGARFLGCNSSNNLWLEVGVVAAAVAFGWLSLSRRSL